MLNWLEKWADRILSIKERKLVLLVVSVLGGLVLIGTAWEKSAPFVHLFHRASSDAGEIAKIKNEVEQQRDLIAAVARDATTARTEMEQSAKLSTEAKSKSDAATESLKKAGEELEAIRNRSDFSLLLARVSADDRKAFDELLDAAEHESNPFHRLALTAIQRVVSDFGSRLNLTMDWKRIGLDATTATLEDFKDAFKTRPTFDKPGILAEIFRQERFGKFDRLSFIYDVIKSTDSIAVLNAGCMTMNEEAKINKNIIGYRDYLKWWDDHAAEYVGAKEYKPTDELELPSDSMLFGPSPSMTP